MVSALNIAWWANLGLSQWQACLDLVEEQESAQRDLGEGELGLAFTRFNQAGPLLRLGRLDEAQRVLEGCLGVFRSSGAVSDEARCLAALADLWDQRGEIDQAIALQHQALAVCNRLANPGDRARSHHNLGNYLERRGQTDEAARHHAAGLTYSVCTGDGTLAGFDILGIRARNALADGKRYRLPPLAEILALDDFAALRRFLDDHGVDREALQAELDRLVDQTHAQATDGPSDQVPPELAQLLEPILAAAQAGEDIEPLLTALGEQLTGMGADESQANAFVDALRTAASQVDAAPE